MSYQIEKNDDYLLVRVQKESLNTDDIRALENILDEYPKENVILHLLAVRSIRQASVLKKLHDHRKKNDLSFIVIVNNGLEDELEVTTALTEQEAYDILDLEEMER